MANFISDHTGAEIDAAIASGSTTTGVIKDFNTLSGSATSTLSIGGVFQLNDTTAKVKMGDNIVGTLDGIAVTGDITASGKIIAAGDITASGGIKADSFHSVASGGSIDFNDNADFSGNVSSSGKIISYDEIHLKDTNAAGDILVKAYASNDDGVLELYRNKVLDIKLSGADGSISASGTITSNDLVVSDKAGIDGAGIGSGKSLTVAGDISSSGDLYIGGSDLFGGTTKRLTLGATNLFVGNVSSSLSSTGSFGRLDATSLPNIGYANFTGSVGIGTTSPGEKLEVVGDISASGTLTTKDVNFSTLPISQSGLTAGQLYTLSGSQLPFSGSSNPLIATRKFVLIA